MRRAFAILALLAHQAVADDLDALCRQLGSASSRERGVAIEKIRRARPEVDAALEAAAGRGLELALAVREARRWDPEAGVADVTIFADLASSDDQRRQLGFNRLVACGSMSAGRAVRRVMEASTPEERCARMRSLSRGAGRDPGWAREALREIRSPSDELRLAAATTLWAHAGREQAGHVRLAIEQETDTAIRYHLWRTMFTLAGTAEDLPALPRDAGEYAMVLELMLGSYSPDLRAAAWNCLQERRPLVIPRAFWEQPSRMLHFLGTESYINEMPRAYESRELPHDLLARLSESPRAELRASAATTDEFSIAELARVSQFLSDPDPMVRQCAQNTLARWDLVDDQKSEAERRTTLQRIGAAARTILDEAAGAGESREVEWAARSLLEAGRSSSSAAAVAYQAFWVSGKRSAEALRALESDRDLGASARRVRRLLEFRLPLQGLGFGQGLESAPRVRSGWLDDLDVDAWRALARSDDSEEAQLAVALMGDAWDRLDRRDDVVQEIRRWAEGQDAAASQAALTFLSSQAPSQLPDRAEIEYREVWGRSRAYVLSRLRASVATGNPIDRAKASLIQSHGDRSLLLAALRAGRFDQPATELSLASSPGEPGLLPILLERLGNLEAPASTTWFGALAGCSPQGMRVVAALARDADRKTRPMALAAILLRPWADALAEPIVESLAASPEAEKKKILLEALRFSPGRNRMPFSPRLADAIASLVLKVAEDPAARDDLEPLLATFGESISRASAEWLAALARDPSIAPIARNYGIDFSPGVSPEIQILAGDRSARSRALSRLPVRSLKSVRLMVMSWLKCGNFNDSSELWGIQRSGEVADLVLLALAADHPEWREEVLRLRRQVRRWNYGSAGAPGTSCRLADGEAPGEFDGHSMLRRSRIVARAAGKAPSALFYSLCAAAFRGDTGDEVALWAVLPRLGPDALPRLVPLLNARTPAIRQAAARALGRLGAAAPRFAAAAVRLSLDGETNRAARTAKLAALVRLDDPAGLRELRAQAGSNDPDERLSAVRGLEQASGAPVAGMLAELAGDVDFPVREAAHSALQRMTRREYSAELPPWATRDWKSWLAAHPEVEFRVDDTN